MEIEYIVLIIFYLSVTIGITLLATGNRRFLPPSTPGYKIITFMLAWPLLLVILSWGFTLMLLFFKISELIDWLMGKEE